MHTLLRTVYTLAFVAAGLVTLSAQQPMVGLKAGANWNNINATDGIDALAPEFQSIDEFHFGLVAELPVAGGFSVQPELNFMTKGFGLREGLDVPLFGIDIPVEVRPETRIRYVEVPLLAKYAFGQPGGVQAYITGGPTFGYATGGQIDTKANILVEVNVGTINLNLDDIDYERFEVGAAVGAGVQADLGLVRAFADARYHHGFTELYKVPYVEEKVKNKGIALSAGLLVPLGR